MVLDVRMPVLNGRGFAAGLRRRGLRLPALALSATHNAERWAEEIEAQACLAKPFDLAHLLAPVQRLLPEAERRVSPLASPGQALAY